MRTLLAIFAILLCSTVASSQNANFDQSKWIIGYYPYWEIPEYPTARIDYTAVNVLSLVQWPTQASGGVDTTKWNAGGTGGATDCTPVVTAAHAAGSKVLMLLGGAGQDGNFDSNITTFQSTFITNIAAVVSACHLDGVDLDWETLSAGSNYTDYASFAQALRNAHPSYIISVFIDGTVQTSALALDMYPYVDRVNEGSYNMGPTGAGWKSWYFGPLYGYVGAPNPITSIDAIVSGWVKAGVPRYKINIGAGFYGEGWHGVTGPLQDATSATVPEQEVPYGWPTGSPGGPGLLQCYYNVSGGTYQYNPSPAENSDSPLFAYDPGITFPSTITPTAPCPTSNVGWITYEDEASILAKTKYVKANGFGGIIVWTLNEGVEDPNTGRSPLLDSMNLGLFNNAVQPLPHLGLARVTGFSSGTIGPITGLSGSLKMVLLKWWNESSSASFDPKSDANTTFGQPSEYFLEGSVSGATWVTLVHITSEHYTGRQFEFDVTGTGYTQFRMRVISIVGSNPGDDDFTVNGSTTAINSNDTWLFFGDSVTANCLAVANNAGDQNNGVEQIGTQVNIARPTRFPVVTVGGQGGWDAAAALDTTTYGIPNIKQFLADLPSAKYVTINLGTNDSNNGVAAATYCTRMQSIVQYIIQAGRTPVIPTILASPSANVLANAPAMNACLLTLERNFPSIIKGPDLWALFSGHSTGDGWFFDALHPSLGLGCNEYQAAWAQMMLQQIYPQQKTLGPGRPTTTVAKLVSRSGGSGIVGMELIGGISTKGGVTVK